jgi:peptide/nickel transport system substrate-binding protein
LKEKIEMLKKLYNRRQFLKGATLAAGVAVLAACAPTPTPTPAPTTAPAAVPTDTPVPTTAPAMPTNTAVPPTATAVPPTATVEATLVPGAPLPRNETMYFAGQQWGTVVGWNPYSSNNNNAMGTSAGDSARVVMFETPYLYDMLDGKQYPLLADGPYAWDSTNTSISFKIKAVAKWSDGTAVTADDVAYTWASHIKYQTGTGVANAPYIDTITASDPQTVVIKAKLDKNGKVVNPLQVIDYVSANFVMQKAWTQTLEKRVNNDATKFMADTGDDAVWSGPYHKFFSDDSKVILIRDDKYWGQDKSMWGKLPVPKYLAHIIYKDNAAGTTALQAGQVDVSQEFNSNVQDLWLKDNLPISTYLPNAPYGIGASLPTIFYNLAAPGLDQVAVRKAIAIAVDYDTIIANAMTNQSATFAQVPRSLMNPTPGEQAMYDQSAVKDLQWIGKDVDGAKKLLDDAGIKAGADGFRTYKGAKLSYVATCPNGWSDWQATIELVAAAGKAIGIDITTNYPEANVFETAVTNWPLPKGYEIFMMWSDSSGPTEPWGRANHFMNSMFAQTKNNWNGNWGGYKNPAADALLAAIPGESDPAKVKDDFTQLVKIYLTDIPSFTAMYRPQSFHTVYEGIWTGYPHQGDGTNPPVPPLDMTDGWGIAALYNVKLVTK